MRHVRHPLRFRHSALWLNDVAFWCLHKSSTTLQCIANLPCLACGLGAESLNPALVATLWLWLLCDALCFMALPVQAQAGHFGTEALVDVWPVTHQMCCRS